MQLFDRVRETTSTTGTGALTLAGADAGYDAVGDRLLDGEESCFVAALGSEWEVFIGTYNSGANTVSRDECLASSNGDDFVNFSAGAKKIWIDYPALLANTQIGRTLAITQGLGII